MNMELEFHRPEDKLAAAEKRIAELEQWCNEALWVIDLGIKLMPKSKQQQWTGSRAVQESCPVKLDD